MDKALTSKSKLLSLVLRHNPEAVGLRLDAGGWAVVSELVHACGITRTELDQIVAENNKKRFVFSEDGLSLRAAQGHSIEVELGYAAQLPPSVLFHGTSEGAVASILHQGLLSGKRQHVHLSSDAEAARQVGMRHGRPVVFRIDTQACLAAGHEFFLAPNGVWLTDHVPAAFVAFEREP